MLEKGFIKRRATKKSKASLLSTVILYSGIVVVLYGLIDIVFGLSTKAQSQAAQASSAFRTSIIVVSVGLGLIFASRIIAWFSRRSND